MYMQLDRTKRAFDRYSGRNIYLEAKVLYVGNVTIRDLLLTKGHLIPANLVNTRAFSWNTTTAGLRNLKNKGPTKILDSGANLSSLDRKGVPFPPSPIYGFVQNAAN